MELIYAALTIHKLGGQVNEAMVTKVVEAAGGKPDHGKIKALVAALAEVDIEKAIKEAALPTVVASSVSSGEVQKKEEKKEELKEDPEKAAAGLSALFG